MNRYQQEDETIEIERLNNVKNGEEGKVICSTMYFNKDPVNYNGFRKVFPNIKHGARKDGLGMPTLSPMSLGPIEHGQPGVPNSINLENFHQGSKCFQIDLEIDGSVGGTYETNRNKSFLDPQPHRHKYKDTKTGKPLIPLYFIWIDKDKKQHKLGYIECRQFYCNFYERLVSQREDFKKLVNLKKSGTNLQIIGYDGRNIKPGYESTLNEYLNPNAPFGHELVLYSMLTIDDPNNYPWRKHKTFEY